MRILILNWKDLAHPLAGGAEVLTEEVARALVVRDHSVTLFTSAVRGRPAREMVQGVEVVRRGGRLGVYRAARRFWNEQPEFSFDIVVDEINTRPFLTPRWLHGTPVVALIHQLAREIWFYETRFPLSALGRYVLEPRWLRRYRNVPAMTVSRSSADSLVRHHGWQNVTVIPEGSTPHPVPGVPKEAHPTVIFLARLVAMKQPEHALRAFEHLAQALPDAQLWIIGDGPLLRRLRERAPARVTFSGRLAADELRQHLARAHVLVSTSVREGWGLNVSEAAACGTPTIGYSVAGLVNSIPASGGALVEPNPNALGRALIDFFAGRLPLEPRLSTVPWPEVAARVESRLTEVAARAARRSLFGATSPIGSGPGRATFRDRGRGHTGA
ncbi:MAG: glycosyltransferase family 1 protein [Candidatus Rokuibacteriota bacterium]|nr:MAG: glycosyltransferase family 1 protein [Candidatus Rokubacteria bacterium]